MFDYCWKYKLSLTPEDPITSKFVLTKLNDFRIKYLALNNKLQNIHNAQNVFNKEKVLFTTPQDHKFITYSIPTYITFDFVLRSECSFSAN